MARSMLLTIAGFVLLGAVAVAGWVRAPQPMAASAPISCYDQLGNPVAAPMNWSSSPQLTPAVARPAYAYAPVQPVVQRQSTAPRRVVRERPFKHSVAIVAGSSGVGAAIGALAGGGRGAGIGALSGGAAGFLYDRLTHKKTEYR